MSAKLSLQIAQQVHDLRADADVKRGHGFIEDNEIGPKRERAGDVDALALASGEFMRVASERGVVESHSAQQFRSAGAQFGTRAGSVDHKRLGDNVAHAHARIESGEGVLKDDLHAAAQRTQSCAARFP